MTVQPKDQLVMNKNSVYGTHPIAGDCAVCFFLAFINTLYIYFKILYGFKILPKNTQKEQLFYRILLVFCEELFGKVFS